MITILIHSMGRLLYKPQDSKQNDQVIKHCKGSYTVKWVSALNVASFWTILMRLSSHKYFSKFLFGKNGQKPVTHILQK
jgi:hypothetical protein